MARPGGWCSLRWCRHGLIWHVFMKHSMREYNVEVLMRAEEFERGESDEP